MRLGAFLLVSKSTDSVFCVLRLRRYFVIHSFSMFACLCSLIITMFFGVLIE